MTTTATFLPTGRMVRIQGLSGPDAADLVVLPRAVYEALAHGPARAVGRERRDGAAEPAAGDTAVRAWRRRRGLSARALAALAGVDAGYLSQIETGKKPGSVRALRALAGALGVSLDDLATP